MNKEHVLILFSNAIGDAIMTFPTIRAFLNKFEKVSFLCEDGLFFVFTEFNFYKIFLIETNPNCFEINLTQDIVDDLKKDHFDYFISLATFHNTSIDNLIKNIHPKVSIGVESRLLDIQNHPQSNIFTYLCGPIGHKMNMFELYFNAIKYFEPKTSIFDYAYKVDLFQYSNYNKISFPENTFSICIHTDTKDDKIWGDDNFSKLIIELLQLIPDAMIYIIGLPKYDFSSLSENILQLPQTDFVYSVELLNNSDMFIGVDSCFMHLSDINKINSIALFGSTEIDNWGYFFNENGKIIQPLSNKMADITVEEVLEVFHLKIDVLEENKKIRTIKLQS